MENNKPPVHSTHHPHTLPEQLEGQHVASPAHPVTPPPATPPAPPTPEEQLEEQIAKLTKAEKDGIIREAVSYYLRQDFRDAVIRKVCVDYMTEVDDAARKAVSSTEASSTDDAARKSEAKKTK